MHCTSSASAPAAVPEEQYLSCQRAVRNSGLHLLGLADRLRQIESVMIAAVERQSEDSARVHRRSRMQALDLVIQELAGLSDILIVVADHLADTPDPVIEALVDLPRLQSLSRALRDGETCDAPSETVLF